MSFTILGPAVCILGDPTEALGAGMFSLGNNEQTAFNGGLRDAFTSSARLNGTPDAAGLYQHAPNPQAQAQFTDMGIDNLARLIANSVRTAAGAGTSGTDVLGGGDEFQRITDVPTLCILPVSQLDQGVSAPNAIWFPGTSIRGLDGAQYGRTPEGEILQPYNVQFGAAYRRTDQNGTAIPKGNRIWFMGPPDELGLAWSLPTDL